nr:hypothetical protein [Tanacetum cinerariifolium]
MTTVRTLIVVTSSHKWKIYQLDVKNAFVNSDLNEEVFMKPPPGVSHKPGEVCKLRKELYGLKQALRAWYEKFATVITFLGFVSSHYDSASFVKQSIAGRFVRYFMGIEVSSLPKGYLLSYSKYICDLLDRAKITDKMVEDIPIDVKAKYTSTDGDSLPEP